VPYAQERGEKTLSIVKPSPLSEKERGILAGRREGEEKGTASGLKGREDLESEGGKTRRVR